MTTMSLADQTAFARIISNLKAAPWVPFDSTAAEELAGIAVRVGFSNTTGDFMAKISKSPTGTLLELIPYAAGNVILDTENPPIVGTLEHPDAPPGVLVGRWNLIPGALQYTAELSELQGGDLIAPVQTFVINALAFPDVDYQTFSALPAGTYYFQVQVVYADGTTALSNVRSHVI